ncbi:hypothetical protein [Moraxella catarrhalis]|uniref:hypothetical protein n=1 Tax=Moraxella catarrhalis TaxID=480 RepID=UPI001D0D960D|nr:hypothetical protein [Moraxella catarrhalis]
MFTVFLNRRQASSVKRQASSVKRQASSVKRQASSVKRQASSVKRQASSVKRQASSVKRQRLSAHDTACQPLNALIFLFLPKPAFMWAFFVSKLCPKGGAK